MTRNLKLLIVFATVLVFSACGGAPAEVAAPEASTPAAVVDAVQILDLPPTVDAQTVAQIKDRADVVIIDVREQSEYDEGHVPGVVLIPTGEVPGRLSEIPTEGTVIVMCRSGNRSAKITQFLRDQGYTNVHNLDGGILSWEQAGLPVER